MILYHNDLLKIDFDPANQLLSATWPNMDTYNLDHARLTLSRLIDTIKNYEAKYLLVDATNTKINLSDAEYREIVNEFISGLLTTKIKRLARIASTDKARETKAETAAPEQPFSIPFKNFPDSASALNWLLENQPEKPE